MTCMYIENNKLDASHLTNATICRINQWAKLDFEYLGYAMIVPSNVMVRVKSVYDGSGYYDVKKSQQRRDVSAPSTFAWLNHP
mmetsp:Transcript_6737/g.12000  ORF Transcript_6737/g.12000 Transcript_6737/m.12000 type:complete len:83 (-) Transcript_6737:114-362(-)